MLCLQVVQASQCGFVHEIHSMWCRPILNPDKASAPNNDTLTEEIAFVDGSCSVCVCVLCVGFG